MMSYFIKARSNYLFTEGPEIFIGESNLLPDGSIRLDPKEFIEKANNLRPTALWLCEADSNVNREEFLKFISNLHSLQSIHLANDYLPLASLPPSNIKAISLLPFIDQELLDRCVEFRWQPEQIVPDVHFFSFFDFDGRYDLGGISPSTFPGLKWIECFIDKKGRTLDTIQGFSNLTTAYLSHVRKHDVFSILQGLRIKMLKLEGFDRGFSFQNIGKLDKLEVLHLNSYRENLDLRLIVDLPLKEVFLLNCTKLEHAEVLLQVPTLESVHIIDCKKPLSDAIKKALKEKLPLVDVDFQ